MPKNGKNILEDGTIKYYNKDKLHRENGPAVIYPDGTFEFWNSGVKLKYYKTKTHYIVIHRILNLDILDNSKTINTIKTVKYFNLEGKLDRKNGPAVKGFNVLKPTSIEYYNNGVLNNKKGPARIEYVYTYHKDIIKIDEWHVNGELHNENGPAFVSSNLSKNKIKGEEYYLNNKKYSKDDFIIQVRKIKIDGILKKK